MNRITLSLLAGVAVLGFAGAAQAADLIIEEPVVSPGVVDVGGNWEGVYLGAFVGGASGDFSADDEDLDEISGWLIGGAVGANFYLADGIVAGVVGDLSWSDIAAEDFDADEIGIDWQGSLRARLGFDGGAFLPYITGGLAVANGNYEGESATHLGWTVGAGVEVAVTEDLSIDALYRYSDFGSAEYGSSDLDLNTHQVTVGLNWKF